jgi:hypothetical protein
VGKITAEALRRGARCFVLSSRRFLDLNLPQRRRPAYRQTGTRRGVLCFKFAEGFRWGN